MFWCSYVSLCRITLRKGMIEVTISYFPYAWKSGGHKVANKNKPAFAFKEISTWNVCFHAIALMQPSAHLHISYNFWNSTEVTNFIHTCTCLNFLQYIFTVRLERIQDCVAYEMNCLLQECISSWWRQEKKKNVC